MQEKGSGARQSAEYTGRSVEAALVEAANDLDVHISELKYEVLEDSRHSFFGLMKRGEVVIRVWLSDQETQPSEVAPAAEDVSEEEWEEDQVEDTDLTEEDDDQALETAPAARMSEEWQELRDVASEVLSSLVDKMGLIAAVEVADEGGVVDPAEDETTPLVLNIVGDDLGILIGRRGETLRDVQFITRLIVSRRMGEWPNIVVDVENYKAKRMASLRALALRLAEQAQRTGQAVALEPMPANERRIVHITLRDVPGVYTESTGEDDHRKVNIIPN